MRLRPGRQRVPQRLAIPRTPVRDALRPTCRVSLPCDLPETRATSVHSRSVGRQPWPAIARLVETVKPCAAWFAACPAPLAHGPGSGQAIDGPYRRALARITAIRSRDLTR